MSDERGGTDRPTVNDEASTADAEELRDSDLDGVAGGASAGFVAPADGHYEKGVLY